MGKDSIDSAIEILVEEIEKYIGEINVSLETAAKNHDYEKTKTISEYARILITFKEKVNGIKKDWKAILDGKHLTKRKRKKSGKLSKGLKTPESKYIIPILSSLLELGGEAKVDAVLEKVLEKMQDVLNEYDLVSLPSNPNIKRWNNTARWCRASMMKQGLLSSGSQRGIWKITEKGKGYLESNIKINS